MNQDFRSVLITGASSGLGQALAFAYAGRGTVLHLCGRNKGRLLQVAGTCMQKGATVYTYLFDVTDEIKSQRAILRANKIKTLDLVIANAGISAGTLGQGEQGSAIRTIMKTNILGCLNTVLPALECMQKSHHSSIAVIASLAGYRGMAGCPAYSASKSSVKALGEALYGQQKSSGITITTICPGFIRTPLTDKNQFYMPFLMSAERAANIIQKAIARRRSFVAFPWILVFFTWLGSCLPHWLAEPIYSILPKKEK